MTIQYLYRYDEILYSFGLDQFDDPIPGYRMELGLTEYEIVKRTPKGAWIRYPLFSLYEDEKKFVLLTARKKFACETKEEALKSFAARKNRQIAILEAKLKVAKEALQRANHMLIK